MPCYTLSRLCCRHRHERSDIAILHSTGRLTFGTGPLPLLPESYPQWPIGPSRRSHRARGQAALRSTTGVRSSGVWSPAGDRAKWHTYVFAVVCLPSIRSESVIDEICISQRNSGNAHGREVGPMLRHGGSHDWHKRMRGCIAR